MCSHGHVVIKVDSKISNCCDVTHNCVADTHLTNWNLLLTPSRRHQRISIFAGLSCNLLDVIHSDTSSTQADRRSLRASASYGWQKPYICVSSAYACGCIWWHMISCRVVNTVSHEVWVCGMLVKDTCHQSYMWPLISDGRSHCLNWHHVHTIDKNPYDNIWLSTCQTQQYLEEWHHTSSN